MLLLERRPRLESRVNHSTSVVSLVEDLMCLPAPDFLAFCVLSIFYPSKVKRAMTEKAAHNRLGEHGFCITRKAATL